MITARLRRLAMGDTGTFGTLELAGITLATGELPDRDNAQRISSIPAGTYTCRLLWSPRFNKPMYHVLDVPGRSDVMFHAANFCGDKSLGLKSEVEGCIALGLARGKLEGQDAVLSSVFAVDRFTEALKGEDCIVEITDEYMEAGTAIAGAA